MKVGLTSTWIWEFPISCGSFNQWYISNAIHWINIILGIVGYSDTMNDLRVFEITLTYMSLFSDFIWCSWALFSRYSPHLLFNCRSNTRPARKHEILWSGCILLQEYILVHGNPGMVPVCRYVKGLDEVFQIKRGNRDNNFMGIIFYSSLYKHTIPVLQIRGDIEDNSRIIFLISQQKHMLWPLLKPSQQVGPDDGSQNISQISWAWNFKCS